MNWILFGAYATIAATTAAAFTAADHNARLHPRELLAAAIVGAAWPIFVIAYLAETTITRANRRP